MKFRWFLGVAATSILIATGSASAVTVSVSQDHRWDSGVEPSGFTSDLGNGVGANQQQNGGGSVIGGGGEIYTFPVAGITPGSGEYDGNIGSQFSSPFGNIDVTRDYMVAEGSGGQVLVTFNGPQSILNILWGTVDTDAGRNVINFFNGATLVGTVSGADIPGLSGNGTDNVLLAVTGFTGGTFTSALFSDDSTPAFEFSLSVPAAVPGPIAGAGLPGLVFAVGGLIELARRRRQRSA